MDKPDWATQSDPAYRSDYVRHAIRTGNHTFILEQNQRYPELLNHPILEEYIKNKQIDWYSYWTLLEECETRRVQKTKEIKAEQLIAQSIRSKIRKIRVKMFFRFIWSLGFVCEQLEIAIVHNNKKALRRVKRYLKTIFIGTTSQIKERELGLCKKSS